MAADASPPVPARRTLGPRLLSVLLLLALWQAAAMLAPGPALPSPVTVFARIGALLADGSLLYNSGVTLARTAAAFAIAMVAGGIAGIALGTWRRLDLLLDPWLVIALNMPALVVVVLCYVWLGLTDAAAVLAVSVNKAPTVAVIIREGARAIDRDLLAVGEAFGLPPGRRFRRIYLPQLWPYALAAARSGLAMAWKIVLVVELIGRSNGVGFELGVYFQFFDIAGILAYGIFFIGIVLVIEEAVLKPIDRRLARWRA